jgi:hypothetical protein
MHSASFRAERRVAPAPVPAVVALVAVAVIVAWEVGRPALPVPFELSAAARSPAAPMWAGRVPMAALAIAGSVAIYMFLARTASRSAGLYAVAVLATAPAWFVHGRTMTGAIVPMACSAAILAGLGVAALDPSAGARARSAGIAVALASAVTSVVASRWGIPNRGIAAVVAIPAAAVGAAHVLWTGTGSRTAGARVAHVALGAGVVITAASFVAAALGGEGWLADLLLGARSAVVSKPTFEAPVAALAYGLVPWTPLVPFALARRPASAGHLAVMIGAVLAIAAHAALAPRSGSTTLVGVAAIAGAVATMLRSLEDARRPATALVATVLAVGFLVAHDVRLAPERVLVAFGATDTAMPAAHAAASSLAIRSSTWLCMALTSVALIVPRSWLPAGRGLAIVTAGVFAGLVLRAHAYPELLSRLSPGAAFDAWAKAHRPGEPLGLLGVDRRAVAFAPGTSVVPQSDPPGAGRWLAGAVQHDGALHAPGEPRRFLALAASELPRVNAEYRAAHARNVPVLAGREGAILLAASVLAPGEHSESPLDAIVLDAPPPGLRPLGAVLDERLDAVGWQLVDDKGRPIEAVPRGSRSAHVRVMVAVRGTSTAPLTGYCTFLHVDHSPARFSTEHRELAYPMSVWRVGDVVVDDFDVKLPAHFRAGSYRMYWGVVVPPCEDDRRMHVTTGPNDGRDRIPAGNLEVR